MSEDKYDEFETVVMTDEDTGEDIEFVVIDALEYNGVYYILVVESEFIDDEEEEGIILKQIKEENENVVFVLVEDDDEFDAVAALFQEKSDDYDVKLD